MSIIDTTRKGTDMDEIKSKSKVYIQTDSKNRITRCEGGYTIGNIQNIEEWIYIDEGDGDRYNLCQSHYFESGLYTEDGICRYVYEDGEARLRTEEEIEADRKAQSIRRADRDYEPGEYLTIEHTMYLVLLPILAGSQITIGTNVEATTVEAEMASLKEG